MERESDSASLLGADLPEGVASIRRAGEADVPIIASFNRAMARETEGRELDEAIVSAGVRALVAHEDRGFYLVAETEGGELAGALMTTYEWSDWRNGLFWWIQSVYVRPDWRRRGIYRALYRHLHREAARASEPRVCGFRLYVEKDNAGARTTYQRLGMTETVYRMFEHESP